MKRLRPLLAALFLSVPLSAAVSGRLISTSEADPSWVAKARASYPLNVCVVSDEELGRMGDPRERIYRIDGQPDRLVIFCCDGCEEDFKSEPDRFLAMLARRSSSVDEAAFAKDTAIAAMNTWLADVDAGDYGRSWDTASSLFQKALARDAWIQALNQVRKPLGTASSRRLLGAQLATKLPSPTGPLEGEFVIAQFSTSFENAPKVVETVTFSKSPDGSWNCAGYFINANP